MQWVKNQKKYEQGVIDCCKVDPESKIIFRFREDKLELAPKEEAEEVERTISLVYEVFTMQNTGMRVYKSAWRWKELQKEMNLLFRNLELLRKKPESAIVLRKLKVLLKRESAFAAFKRCYVREHLLDYPMLEAYVNESVRRKENESYTNP